MPTVRERLMHAWNAFVNTRDPTDIGRGSYAGGGASYRADRPRLTHGNERSIVTAIYNRMAVDVASIEFRHVRVDENKQYLEDVNSGLNNVLTVEANLDQTGRAFIQDIVMSMFDDGVICVVPTDTTIDPKISSAYDVLTARVGRITQWFPEHVKVRLYNQKTGNKEELVLPKRMVGIIENPFYATMNEHNSVAQRLIRKLNLLDAIDEQAASGKMDLIIQLPYAVKSPMRREEAEKRRKDIEVQLTGSKYGIAYMDATEKITQLNRPLENNLLNQIDYLTQMLFNQLGISENIMNGTASDLEMLNYYNHTIEPICAAIIGEFKRKFITKTARTQGQSIMSFRDRFSLVTARDIADIGDAFTRNEIVTKNEFRGLLGMKPSDDPKADMLLNSNINQQMPPYDPNAPEEEVTPEGDPILGYTEDGFPIIGYDEAGEPIIYEDDEEIQNGS